MPKLSKLLGGGRSLAVHLDRLRLLLDGLSERLRDGVARAVGQTVANAAHAAVQTLLSDDAEELEPARGGDYWLDEDLDNDRHYRSPYARHYDTYEDEPPEVQASTARGERWRPLLALSCQAATWWLRQQRPSYPVLAAVGVGLASAAALYLGSPWLLAGAGLGGSALTVALLADAVHAGVAALAGPRGP